MKDEAPLLSNGLVDDEQDEWTTGPTDAAPRLAAPPATCEEALAAVGAVKKAVYVLVRHCVDELEKAAPWELLYYPPEEPDTLLAMVGGLVAAIKAVPKKIDMLLRKLPAGESVSGEPAREDIGFLFHGIHRMVAHDLKRLEGTLAPVRDRGPEAPPGAGEKQRLCEQSADLKGKYASALMGAAASLIGEKIWNSVELEPVLFPEKAEEFRCTRDLVVSLRDAVASIRQLPEQIPFEALLERWRQQARVDQYALADLPSLRGKIGRLLKEHSRRALYSGDYHQISRREVLLSQRINELERLHQQTWALPAPPDPPRDLAPVYARLVQLTLEVAAVLDANILKALIGEKKVNGLRGRAASAPKGQPPRTVSADGLDDLVPLLAEDDLRIFFEMLLTAVQRRASLSVQEPAPPAPPTPPKPVPAAPPPSPPPAPAAPPPRVRETPREPEPAPAPAPRPPADPRPVLARIEAVILELQSPANQSWNSFRMTQRLLEKHSRLPAAMFHAVNPFLQEITGRLIPDLKAIAPYKGLTLEAVQRLETVCRELCDEDPMPAQLADEVPRKLERILRFLDALRAIVQ